MPGPARSGAVLSVGRLYCDLVLTGVPRMPSPGTEIFVEGLQLRAGGGAFTTAAYLSALGQRAVLAANLSGPPFDALLQAEIDGAGIELAPMNATASTVDPQLTVALVGASDRAFVTHRSGPAVPELSPDLPERFGLCHVHVGEVATLVEAPWVAEYAASAGMTLSLDCGWDESLGADEIARAIAAADLFLPNETEVAWLAEHGVHPQDGTLWVEKRGAAGAAVLGAQTISAPARAIETVDPTGAGDAFNAGFLVRWLAGAPLSDCLRQGNACGELAIRCLGGFDPAVIGPALRKDGTADALSELERTR